MVALWAYDTLKPSQDSIRVIHYLPGRREINLVLKIVSASSSKMFLPTIARLLFKIQRLESIYDQITEKQLKK